MRPIPITFAAAMLLAGCAAPDLGPPPALSRPTDYAATTSLATPVAAAWPAADWWHGYGDPQLDALIAEALAGSPDITVAAARVRAAQGSVEQAGAAGLPQLGAEATGGLNRQSYNNGIPEAFVPKGWNDTGRVALNASFDLDLWGRNRAALVAATSEAEATRLDAAQAALMLATNVASAYADLARLYAERDVLERALALRAATEKLVDERVAIGLDTQGELKQARSAVPAARVDLAANAERISLAKNAIAALLGAGPDRGLAITRPAVPTLAAEGLPADAGIELVGRRPDIAAARARADAAASRIKVARADFYPNLSLSGLIGLQSLGLSNLIQGSSTIGSVGPALSLPIFDGGRLRGAYRQARGQYDEAVAGYDRILIAALREVADAATSRRQLDLQLGDARASLADAEGAYHVAQLRYRGGLSTFLNVLSAEQTVLTARASLAGIESRRFSLDVALVRALGGGFRPPLQISGTR
jgi:NodT family efflux transporter outer membrane factor (OMF) lipoprotein